MIVDMLQTCVSDVVRSDIRDFIFAVMRVPSNYVDNKDFQIILIGASSVAMPACHGRVGVCRLCVHTHTHPIPISGSVANYPLPCPFW